MKKERVKKLLKGVLIVGVFVLLFICSTRTTERAVKECIENGNSEAFCRYQLER